MADNKRYYWLKLKEDFFNDKRIKKLRTIAGGDTYTIIYLKLQLLSLKDEGNLYFDNVEDTFIEELALEIDEQVEDVKVCIMYLIKTGLIQEVSETEYSLPETKRCIGSETASTIRSRICRENRKMLQGNTDATNCNIEIDIDKEIDKDSINNMNIIYNWDDNQICDCITQQNEKCLRRSSYNIDGKNHCNQHSKPIIGNYLDESKKNKRFQKPTLEEVKQYCLERKNNIDAQKFVDYYESNGWKVGRNPMKDWKATIRTWESNNKQQSKPKYVEAKPKWLDNEIIDDDILSDEEIERLERGIK